MDAVFDGLAPLRWCLFAEPVHVYRKTPVRLEAVLANEDALPPGEYPVRLQVVGPERDAGLRADADRRRFRSAKADDREPPLVLPVFAEDVVIDGPAGQVPLPGDVRARRGGGGEAVEFYVDDPAADAAGRDGGGPVGRRRRTGQWLDRARHPRAAVRRRGAAPTAR